MTEVATPGVLTVFIAVLVSPETAHMEQIHSDLLIKAETDDTHLFKSTRVFDCDEAGGLQSSVLFIYTSAYKC